MAKAKCLGFLVLSNKRSRASSISGWPGYPCFWSAAGPNVSNSRSTYLRIGSRSKSFPWRFLCAIAASIRWPALYLWSNVSFRSQNYKIGKILLEWEIIQLMKISDICKAFSRCYDCEMDIQVAIWLLGRLNHGHEFFHSSVNLCIMFPFQRIAGALDPFSDIRIPEQMAWEWPHVWFVVVRGMPFQLKGIVAAGRLQYIQLVQQSVYVDDFPPSIDKTRR